MKETDKQTEIETKREKERMKQKRRERQKNLKAERREEKGRAFDRMQEERINKRQILKEWEEIEREKKKETAKV